MRYAVGDDVPIVPGGSTRPAYNRKATGIGGIAMKSQNYVYDKHGNYKFLIEDGVLLKTYLASDYDRIREIEIPDSVTELSKSAFSNCEVWNVTRIFIPKTVSTVQNGAFHEFAGEFIIDKDCNAVSFQDGIREI